ncbi:LodA/GoxA family CTQ-dependent oxidase [Paraflavitalea pollutisoli]|uniref:LodA/GoxA family CTQ-dependent oxidase n=1 Tax=Paraflavitalea pollutisoli TaxID=3034143 RepID=UPI0023EBA43F|nr:LodA/GoxA family CTQ-dependent oxidase [Paraflavitalea sp. H1-2-19X]
MNRNDIKKVAIYPAIGIARIGNSPEYFLASDEPGKAPAPEGGYKDGDNLFKKQVPRFRIYALDANNQPIGELHAGTDGLQVEISWTVHIANRKAGWYQFNNALDLGEQSINSTHRNGGLNGVDRHQLVIDPGTRTIAGINQSGDNYKFDSGKFFDKTVPLGELRTDDQGRLLVFGGDGNSASRDGRPAITFANNDGWHDDVSDGTVRATVTINGATMEATPAFVVCTPPNFGPGLFSLVTMYDVVYDLYVREGWLEGPSKLNFWEHIYPILQRMTSAQWVNEGFFMLFGTNSPSDFNNPEFLKILSDPSAINEAQRKHVFKWFRNTASDTYQPDLIPPYYGDLFGDYEKMPHVDLSVTATQYSWLNRWADGDFTTGTPPVDTPFEAKTPAQQVAALLKAPLEECLGGPFHPGIEITWPFRHLSMWMEPFRLKVLPENKPVSDDYGPLLTPAIALGPNGPLDGSGPGSITRWLGVPWQTDEASCLSGYDTTLYLPIPSFWAARVPNHIFSMDSFMRATKSGLNSGQRLKHFAYRVDWLRDFSPSYVGRINNMIARWHQLGVIAKHTNKTGDPFLPVEWWVETERSGPGGDDPTYIQVIRAEQDLVATEVPGEEAVFLTEGAPRVTTKRESHPVKRHEL